MKNSIEELRHLWKLADPQWIQQRQKDWNIVLNLFYADLEEPEQNVIKSYFLEGARSNCILSLDKIFLTPINTPEDARKLYFSDFVDPQTRISLLTIYFRAYVGAEQLDWFRNHCQIIATGVLGDSYSTFVSAIEEKDGKAPFKEPSFAFSQFVTNIRLVLQGRRAFSGYIYLIEHAISMIGHIKDDQTEITKSIFRLYEDVDYVLSDPSSTEIMLNTARSLLSVKNTCYTNTRNNTLLNEADIGPRREVFGGWMITDTDLTGIPVDKQTKTSANEMIGHLAHSKTIGKITNNAMDEGGKFVKKDDSLVFRFDKAGWLLLSFELYKSTHFIEYHAYHLGDESDIHLFSITSSGDREYVKFYLDNKEETPVAYRKKFADDFKKWRFNLPKAFMAFSGTRELVKKTLMVINDDSFKQS